MPIHPRITQRVARDKACKLCMLHLAVSGVMSYGVLHELWMSPFPKNNLGMVFKYGLCAFSILPVMTFFFECCVDPGHCDNIHGHLLALRVRDLAIGALYWGIGFWLPADVVEEAQRDMQRDLDAAQNAQDMEEDEVD